MRHAGGNLDWEMPCAIAKTKACLDRVAVHLQMEMPIARQLGMHVRASMLDQVFPNVVHGGRRMAACRKSEKPPCMPKIA